MLGSYNELDSSSVLLVLEPFVGYKISFELLVG